MAYVETYSGLVTAMQTFAERDNDQKFIDNIPIFILFGQRRIAREVKILGMQKYVLGTFIAAEGVIAKPTLWLQTVMMRYGGKAGVAYAVDVTDQGDGYQFPPTVTGGNGTAFQSFVRDGKLVQIGVVNGGTGNAPSFPLTITAAADDPGIGAAATASAYVGNNTSAPLLPRMYEFCRFYWDDATLVGDPEFYCDYDYNHWLVVPTPVAALPIEIGYYMVADLLDEDHQTNWLTDNAPDLLLYACMVEGYTFLKNVDQISFWKNMYNDAKAGFVVEDDGRASDRSVARKSAITPAALPGPGGG